MSILRLNEYEVYLRSIELSKGSIRAYITTLKGLDEYLIENEVIELDKPTLVDYKDILIEKYPNKTTVNNKIVAINRYLRWAVEKRYINDPTDIYLKQTKKQTKMFREHITPTEFNRLINVIERRDILLFVLVAANVGLRISEICSLKKSDLNESIIYVYNKGKEQPKSIPIWLRKELKDHMKDKDDNDLIFPLSQTRYREKLKEAARKARIREDKVYPHSFRHMFGSDWANNHRSVAVLQQLLGHSSIKTTQIYTNIGVKDIVGHYKQQSYGKRSKALKNK